MGMMRWVEDSWTLGDKVRMQCEMCGKGRGGRRKGEGKEKEGGEGERGKGKEGGRWEEEGERGRRKTSLQMFTRRLFLFLAFCERVALFFISFLK